MRTRKETTEIIPVPLDSETITRLAWVARETGLRPTETASALLRDLLDDMQFWDAFGHGDTLN